MTGIGWLINTKFGQNNNWWQSGQLSQSNNYCWWRIYQSFMGAVVAEWLSSWLAEQEVQGSIPRLATWISEIGYLLLPSCDMGEITLKRRKSSIQPTNQSFIELNILIVVKWPEWWQCVAHFECTESPLANGEGRDSLPFVVQKFGLYVYDEFKNCNK